MENPAPELNVTPLIDVLLVLLILFIMTVPVMTHSVGLDLPSSTGKALPQKTVNVDIDSDGQVFWNGALSPNDQSLERWFRSARDEPQAPLVRIYPDRRAPYRRVAQVLAAAQRAHVQKLALDPVSD
jgi:biopolymer transport protein ExbD